MAKLGRPPLLGKTMRKKLVVLDAESIRRAKLIGGGNVSAGIRKALAAWKLRKPKRR